MDDSIRPSIFPDSRHCVGWDLPPGSFQCVPPAPKSSLKIQAPERKYWKQNIIFTLFPLLFCGVPVHLLALRKNWIAQDFRQWFRLVFCPSTSLPKTLLVGVAHLIFVVVLAVVNWIIGSSLGILVYSVVILGILQFEYLGLLYNTLRIILLFLVNNYLWISGYVPRNILKKLLNLTTVSKIHENAPPLKYFRLRLFLLYFLIVFIHSVHFHFYSLRISPFDSGRLFVNFLLYTASLAFSTLLFPPYINICWMIGREFEVLGEFLRKEGSSTEIGMPDVDVLDKMKTAEKFCTSLYDVIAELNSILSWLISIAIVVLIFSTTVEMTDLVIAWPEGGPARVRTIIGFLSVIGGKVGLLSYTIHTFRKANNEARYLLVHLNQFATNTETPKESGTYQAVRTFIKLF